MGSTKQGEGMYMYIHVDHDDNDGVLRVDIHQASHNDAAARCLLLNSSFSSSLKHRLLY